VKEPLTEPESLPQTVTITLGHRALVVGLAVLVMAGAMALGVWVGKRLSAPKLPLQRVSAPAQVPIQVVPRVQVPASSLQRSRSGSPDTAGISANVGAADSALDGQLAPGFSLENLQGERVSLSDLKGQPILINFWATWCPPCRFEMPVIEAAYQKYRDQGFVVLAVDVQEPRGLVQSYVKRLGLAFPVVLDRDGQVAADYRVRAYPTSVFINRKGEIMQIHRGMMTAEMIERYLANILPEG